MLPNKFPAGGAEGAVAPPNPAKSEVAGGLPAGVVDSGADVESEKKPSADCAGAVAVVDWVVAGVTA
jgi:hypothetical protein